MIQKFNSNNKLLRQIEKYRQALLSKLTEGYEHETKAIIKDAIKKADRMIYNILMTGYNTNE